ncbi:MAG: hypothetical protein MJ078_08985, partial [Clostridia bacterium]|nr:hypothetical protein [Clostridia bacterium]
MTEIDSHHASICDVIGTEGYPVEVYSDASLKFPDGKSVTLCEGVILAECEKDPKYPVVTEKYTAYDSPFEAKIFVDETGEYRCVLIELTVENVTDTEIFLPTIDGFATDIESDTVPAGESTTVHYTHSEKLSDKKEDAKECTLSFSEHYAHMTNVWDELFDKMFRFTGDVPEEIEKAFNSYLKESTVAEILKKETRSIIPSLDKDAKDINFAALTATADKIISSISELQGQRYLILTDGVPNLGENLHALAELKAYTVICDRVGKTKDKEKAESAYSALLSSVTYTLKNTEASLKSRFEAAT